MVKIPDHIDVLRCLEYIVEMKWGLLLGMLLSITSANAMNILVTYFDPFGGKPNNNSNDIAHLVGNLLHEKNHKVALCELRTVFDRAYEQLKDCMNSLSEPADMVISLGESGCGKVRVETRGINFDKSYGADNDGLDRHGAEIIPNGPKSIGVTLPIDKAFCSLSKDDREKVFISHSAGSFVCNNTLYLGLYNLEIPYTFIHVPEKRCSTASKNSKNADVIAKMIHAMTLMNLENVTLPANKSEVKNHLESELNSCESMFYNILKKEY